MKRKTLYLVLNLLNNLQYPENKLEIIIVDDASTDNTSTLISNFIKNKSRFRTLSLEEAESAKLKGKVQSNG